MSRSLYAILLDGAFLTKRLYGQLGRHVGVDDIEAECTRLQGVPLVQDYELLRIYYYDASPSSDQVRLPVSKNPHNLGDTEQFRRSESIYSQLVLRPYFSLRLGHVIISPHRWKMKPGVSRELIKEARALRDDDFILDISQKGVDMRIGMDMARLALREMVCAVIVVTGDSDFVPAFKFVRREGVKVFLEPMGTNPRHDLRAHADIVL